MRNPQNTSQSNLLRNLSVYPPNGRYHVMHPMLLLCITAATLSSRKRGNAMPPTLMELLDRVRDAIRSSTRPGGSTDPHGSADCIKRGHSRGVSSRRALIYEMRPPNVNTQAA